MNRKKIGALAVTGTFVLSVLLGVMWIISKEPPSSILQTDSTKNMNSEQGLIPNDREHVENSQIGSVAAQDKRSKIVLADREFHIQWHELDLQEFQLPPGYTAMELYERLRKKALNGDAIAARLLALELERCQEAFLDRQQHDNSISQINTSAIYTSPRGVQVSVNLPKEDVSRFLEQLENEFEHCKDLPNEKRLESEQWAGVAAEGKDFQGAQLYVELAGEPGVKEERALELWKEFGYVPALYELAMLNHKLASPDLGYSYDSSKKIRATAFLMLAGELSTTSLSADQMVDAPNIYSRKATALDLVSEGLSASEYSDAEKMAIALLTNNENCCVLGRQYGRQ